MVVGKTLAWEAAETEESIALGETHEARRIGQSAKLRTTYSYYALVKRPSSSIHLIGESICLHGGDVMPLSARPQITIAEFAEILKRDEREGCQVSCRQVGVRSDSCRSIRLFVIHTAVNDHDA
jgi:hypothetical protein